MDIDVLIGHLLAAKSLKPTQDKIVNIDLSTILKLCNDVRTIVANQPVLLELTAPMQICGDIHGQYFDLLRMLQYGGLPPQTNYLFLGDYVDRGAQSLETICLLFAYKVKYPNNFFLLRGNHECPSINRIYGFYDECKRRYNVKLWKAFTDVFNWLPLAALIDDRIFCCHGGLAKEFLDPSTTSLQKAINDIRRPSDIPDTGIMCDLLWADPYQNEDTGKPINGWAANNRGVSYAFGPDVVEAFCKKFDLDLVCRAHQCVEDGYEFFANRKLVTIFSAPNYCNEGENCGAMMTVDANLLCSFQILKPVVNKPSTL